MRVALIIDNLAAGGAQKHLVQLARGLRANGHHVMVFCLNEKDVDQRYRNEIAECGADLRVSSLNRIATGWGLIEIAIAMWRERMEIAATFLFGSTLVGRLAAKLAGISVVVTCIQARNINFARWQFASLKATAGLTTAFTSNSRTAISFACENEGIRSRQTVFIANGIEPDGAAKSSVDRASVGLPFESTDWVIGSVGRLDWQKGFDVLLDAFAVLTKKVPSARLVIVGEGHERAALLEQAKHLGVAEHVFFAGKRDDVPRLLPHLDVYTQPSRFEGTPNAVMEAMAAGLPVVVSAADGNAEIVEHGKTGWVVPIGESMALAAQLEAIWSDRKTAAGVALAGQRAILFRFALERMVDSYLALFQSLRSPNAAQTVI